MRDEVAEILNQCVEIALKSGEIIRDAWDRPGLVRHKGVTDLVTSTDVEVQAYLKQALGELLPEAAFVGEEGNEEPLKNLTSLCWIVDPVDGTTNFVHRFPVFATSIGLWNNGKPVFGVVNAPMIGEIFYGGPGLGAFRNKEKIHVSNVRNPQDALVSTGFPYEMEPELKDILTRLSRILPATQGLRRPGCASLDLACVACGRFDAYFEHTLKPWDMAGGIAVVLEAGGEISSFNGQPYSFGQPLLASNGIIHGAISELLTADS